MGNIHRVVQQYSFMLGFSVLFILRVSIILFIFSMLDYFQLLKKL